MRSVFVLGAAAVVVAAGLLARGWRGRGEAGRGEQGPWDAAAAGDAVAHPSSLVPRRSTLSTGVTLEYIEQGDPTGVPVVLVHGFSDSWKSWQPVLPLLPPSLHVFAISMRGHGESDRPAGPRSYAMDSLAADVLAFMDARGLARAALVGHSLGTWVVQQAALDAPARVSRLVLIAPSADSHTPAVIGLADVLAGFGDGIPPSFLREFQESTVYRPVAPEFMEQCIAESAKLPPHVWSAVAESMLRTDLRPRLASLAAPTLVLWGDRDTIFGREQQDALARSIPDARLEVLPDVGHAVHWEVPREAAAHMVSFLSR